MPILPLLFSLQHILRKNVLSQITGFKRPDFAESPVFSRVYGYHREKFIYTLFYGDILKKICDYL